MVTVDADTVRKNAKRPVELFTDFATLSAAFRQIVKPGDVVLLKGHNSKKLWRILEESAIGSQS